MSDTTNHCPNCEASEALVEDLKFEVEHYKAEADHEVCAQMTKERNEYEARVRDLEEELEDIKDVDQYKGDKERDALLDDMAEVIQTAPYLEMQGKALNALTRYNNRSSYLVRPRYGKSGHGR